MFVDPSPDLRGALLYSSEQLVPGGAGVGSARASSVHRAASPGHSCTYGLNFLVDVSGAAANQEDARGLSPFLLACDHSQLLLSAARFLQEHHRANVEQAGAEGLAPVQCTWQPCAGTCRY